MQAKLNLNMVGDTLGDTPTFQPDYDDSDITRLSHLALESTKSQLEKRTGFLGGQSQAADLAVAALLAYSRVLSSLA